MDSEQNNTPLVLKVTGDLVFSQKITEVCEQLACRSAAVRSVEGLEQALENPLLCGAIVELDGRRIDPYMVIERARARHPELPIIAFASHTAGEDMERAALSGATRVLPRSQFVAQVATIVSHWCTPSRSAS